MPATTAPVADDRLREEVRLLGKLLGEVIRTHVPDDAPLLVAGDFNDWRQRAHATLERSTTSLTATGVETVVGGTAAAQWDTNQQPQGHDMSGNFTLRPNFGRGNNPNCSQAQVLAGICFAGLINDPIITARAPKGWVSWQSGWRPLMC